VCNARNFLISFSSVLSYYLCASFICIQNVTTVIEEKQFKCSIGNDLNADENRFKKSILIHYFREGGGMFLVTSTYN